MGDAPARVELPATAHQIASLQDAHVVYVHLDTSRVRKAEASEVARLVSDQLGGDILMVVTNDEADQLHFIYPTFDGIRPTLRRMVVERDLPRRTAIMQIANIFHEWESKDSIHLALDSAFNVEAVTDKFFEEYERVFGAALDKISGFGTDESEQEAKKLFTQTLFNRLMFVYFISRKGWLSFNGDKDYLKALWNDYASKAVGMNGEPNFRYDRLRPLFFGGLNNDVSQDLTTYPDARRLIGIVPFLNGGLFEETDLDRRTDVTVPDEVIRSVFDELFDRFNFTVMESTPFDIEVAVDPEMLGKVFEELVTGRHESGSYYTPRPVVSFMCREALKGYLEDRGTSLPVEAISAFVDDHDTSGVTVAAARSVGRALDEITVVDPACGSGAYLLGMMQELVELQTALYNAGLDAKSLYDLKLQIIERNLYGVDIDPFAVNIAMLRLWLSLAIEYEGEVPEPLPNLDFKIVCGDSLLGPDPSPDNYGDLFRHQVNSVAGQLANLKSSYMEATGPLKDHLREKIAHVQVRLTDALTDSPAPKDAADWRVEFVEVFSRRRGFDVVVANPPYVVIKNAQLRAMYKEGIYGRMNTYGLFIQRSLQLMNEGSQLLFINPRTLLTDKYFTNLRKVIRQRSQLKGVVLIADRHNTFERVLQECIVLHLARRAKQSEVYSVKTRAISVPTDLNDPHDMVSVTSDRVLLRSEYDGSFYIGESEFDYEVFERMNSEGVRLSAFGLKAETGKIQFDKYQKYARPTSAKDTCRLLWAENIQRYVLRESSKRVGKEWMANQITAIVPPNISGSGIVTQRVSANEQPRRIIATLLSPGETGDLATYSENHTNFIPMEDETLGYFLIASLNSSPMEYVFRRLNSNTQVSAGEINRLPFPPRPSLALLEEIKTYVLVLLDLRGVDSEPDATPYAIECERHIDRLIGSLYGFSPTEIKVIQVGLPSYERVYGVAAERQQGLSSLLRALEKIRQSVPASEWAKLPTDGAANYKHYLYGHPKDSEQ